MNNKYFLLPLLLVLQLFPILNYAQQVEHQTPLSVTKDSTKEKPVQFRRGTELNTNYQTYEEKYSGKNLDEEKRRLFPMQSTGIWTELNPKVPRVTYVGIHFVNKDTGWAAGDLGTLIKTTDGGSNYTLIETNTTTPILKVRSYNGQIVIASGYDGLILRSTDGGDTFTQVNSGVGNGFDLWGLEMINDTLGLACGATALLKTADAGLNWEIENTPGYTGNLWWIDFMNEDYGFVAGDGKILRTIDGGSNWEIIQAGDNQALYCVDVIDSSHIAAAGYGGTSYPAKNIYSSDGGYTWINGGFLTTENVNVVKYVNRDTGYVIMNNVIGWKTTNRGQQWTGMAIGGEWEMQLFENDNFGYSAGTELRIYKTENGYENWQRIIINDNFSDVFFVNEQKGFAISSSAFSAPSGLYETTDSGLNWQKYPSGLNGVDLLFLDSLTGFIGSNQIYKTTDGGGSWYVPNGGQGGAGKIFFINETTGWAIRSGTIYKTTDRGENWFEQSNSGWSFTSIYFVDSLYGWASQIGGRPYKTTDGGTNWIQQTNLNIWESRDIYFRDSLNGFIVNGIFELLRTTNSGTNWFIQLTSQYVIRNFGWLSSSHGFIVGDGVYETTDSSSTWNEVLELRNVGLRKLQSPKNYLGYSSGYLGLIFKYVDTTIVPVELISFSAEVNKNIITLKWSTATETNNLGFEVERISSMTTVEQENWGFTGFVEGKGTTTEQQFYSFSDKNLKTGKYKYRLKQIDFDGSFEYSDIIAVEIGNPSEFQFLQNYPNPFNPTTKIGYKLKERGYVKLYVYDIKGELVEVLVNQTQEAGYYEVEFNGEGKTELIGVKNPFVSGVYLCQIIVQSERGIPVFSDVIKMVFLK